MRGATDAPLQRLISASLFLHPGFLIIDHIHFQYNGFLFGILLWSLLMAREVGASNMKLHLTVSQFWPGQQISQWLLIRCPPELQTYLYVSRGASFLVLVSLHA